MGYLSRFTGHLGGCQVGSAGLLIRDPHIRDVNAQSGRQSDLVVLLIQQYLADVLRGGELAQLVALFYPPAIVANGLVLVVQVKPQHVLGLFRRLHRLG